MVLINIADTERAEPCLSAFRYAYDDIKDRKGKMVAGVFVKESALINQQAREAPEQKDIVYRMRL